MSKLLILLIFGISITTFADDYRSYTDKEGRIIRAKIIKVDLQTMNVTVERENKRKFTVPIDIFSETDQSYILSWTPATKPTGPVFRKPFNLKLPVSKEQYYEQEYPEIPYVTENNVYIFPGEKFRVGITFSNGKVKEVTYDPDEKSDQYLEFQFKPRISESDGKVSMMLITKNQAKQNLVFDALMVVPDKQSPLETSIVPIPAGLSSYESWPHPVLQLMLSDFRIK